MSTVVASLVLYPLKGARGTTVEWLDLDARGPRGDRRWMLVDGHGRFVSLREVSRLCFVSVDMTAGGLRLSLPGGETRVVERPEGPGAAWVDARVWSGECRVVVAERSVSEWLSAFLGVECRLVWQPDDAEGPAADGYGLLDGQPRRIALTDGAPLLLTSESSLADLNDRLPAPVPMYRFRPNVVVRGALPWAEEQWRHFTVGTVPFEASKPCPRCVATTVDYETGQKGQEPLRTLATFRRVGTEVNFGMNVAHRSLGTLRVGDELQVLRSGS